VGADSSWPRVIKDETLDYFAPPSAAAAPRPTATVIAPLPRLPADVLNGVATDVAARQATVTAEGTAVPIVYGRQPVGAHIFALGTIDSDLVLGCAWCLGEIEAVESVLINGEAPPGDVTVTSYVGANTQTADATLVSAVDNYSDTLVVTLAGELVGVAYSVVRVPAAFGSFPRVEAIVQGRKVADLRENLATYSEQFDNAAWSKLNGASITATDKTSPTGALTACTLDFAAATNSAATQNYTAAVGTTYVWSVWLRSDTAGARVDLLISDGIASTSTALTLTTSWARYFVERTSVNAGVATNGLQIRNGTAVLLDVDVWGAQLNSSAFGAVGLSPTGKYVPTEAAPVAIGDAVNLLTYSEQFDNAAWAANGGLIITADATTAPDDTKTGDKLDDQNAAAWGEISQATAGSAVGQFERITASVYIKQDSTPAATRFALLRLLITDTSERYCDVMLDTQLGTTAVDNNHPVQLDVYGSGATLVGRWWRVWISAADNQAATTSARLQIAPAVGAGTLSTASYSAATTGSVLAWGAQICPSARLQPLPYTPTTSAAATAPGRDNLLLYSEQFDNAAWTKGAGVTVAAKVEYSPDRSFTAAKISHTTPSAYVLISQLVTTTAATTYTASVYACRAVDSGTKIDVRLFGTGGAEQVSFDFYFNNDRPDTFTALGGAVMLDYGAEDMHDGWWRVWITGQLPTATTVGLMVGVTSGTPDVLLWGGQLNKGPLKPYAATSATAAAPADTYTTNPAVVLADFIASPLYGRGTTVDSRGMLETASECDQLMPGGLPRRAVGLTLDAPAPVAQWVDVLRTYAGCFVSNDKGRAVLTPDRPVDPVASLTDTDIAAGSFKLTKSAQRDKPTVVAVRYTDAGSTPWREGEAIAYGTGVLEGTAPRREEIAALPGITTHTQAYREAVERLNAHTLADLRAEWLAFDESIRFVEGDVVSITHDIGLTAKTMRITSVSPASAGRYRITAAEYSAAIYSDAVQAHSWSDTALPSPNALTAPVLATPASGTAHLLALADGSILSRMLVSWTAYSDPYFRHVSVRFKRAADSDWTYTTGVTEAYCSPVEDGVTYNIEARAENSLGLKTGWTSINHTVTGKSEPPAPPTGFLITVDADGTRRFSWAPPAPLPVDLHGYRLRAKLGTGQVWADMAPLNNGVITASPFETNQLAAGAYTFGLVAVDTTGNESTAVYIEATITDPRLAGALAIIQEHDEGWPGTLTNCWLDTLSNWVEAEDLKDWADFDTDGHDWTDWTAWTRSPANMTYTGAKYDIGVVTAFSPLVSGDYTGTATVEVRTSDDDITWTGWAAPSGQVTARWFQARIALVPVGGRCVLNAMTSILDAKTISDPIQDLDTSTLTGAYRIGTGDIRLPITKSFALITGVGDFALQNVGAGWTWELIDKDTTTGPRIKIYNASSTLADATIDATPRGIAS